MKTPHEETSVPTAYETPTVDELGRLPELTRISIGLSGVIDLPNGIS